MSFLMGWISTNTMLFFFQLSVNQLSVNVAVVVVIVEVVVVVVVVIFDK